MLRSNNRQRRSVGNLGDVLKHGALVELASLLARRRAAVSFVETHAFLLHAPLADESRWRAEVSARLAWHPALDAYAALEGASLARAGRYRCSSGLVLDVLGDARGVAVLAEANGATRAELAEQIAEAGLSRVFVVDEARAIDRASRVPGGGALLVHVDPFALDESEWSPVAPALDALCGRSTDAVLVAYRYSRAARAAWPGAPVGTSGPIVEVRGGPHEVAVYASRDVSDEVREACVRIGFRPSSSEAAFDAPAR